MDNLEFPLALLADQDVAIDAAVRGEDLGGDHARELKVGTVRVVGTLAHAGHDYLFNGAVSGTFCRTCDRCLYEVDLPFEVTVLWTFVRGTDRHPLEEMGEEGDDADGSVFDGNTIDLSSRVWEEVVLAYPVKFVACEDRPDLVPECQADETITTRITFDNEREPGGAREDKLSNRGFAALADMFPDLPPTDSEE